MFDVSCCRFGKHGKTRGESRVCNMKVEFPASRLEGLESNVIPVQPISTQYRVKITTVNGQDVQRTIKSQQYTITPAYVFTDYRSQGVTIPYIVLDIAPPPTGTLNHFNLYVAFFRSRGRESIRLLRDSDDAMFYKKHDEELNKENERLTKLDEQTHQWYDEVIRPTQIDNEH